MNGSSLRRCYQAFLSRFVEGFANSRTINCNISRTMVPWSIVCIYKLTWFFRVWGFKKIFRSHDHPHLIMTLFHISVCVSVVCVHYLVWSLDFRCESLHVQSDHLNLWKAKLNVGSISCSPGSLVLCVVSSINRWYPFPPSTLLSRVGWMHSTRTCSRFLFYYCAISNFAPQTSWITTIFQASDHAVYACFLMWRAH